MWLITKPADLGLRETRLHTGLDLRNFFTLQKSPKTLAEINHVGKLYISGIDKLYDSYILPTVSNTNILITNAEAARKQLEKLIPSGDALALLDGLMKFLRTNRRDLGLSIGIAPETIAWAFERGKEARAKQVRKLVLAEVDRRIEAGKETVAA